MRTRKEAALGSAHAPLAANNNPKARRDRIPAVAGKIAFTPAPRLNEGTIEFGGQAAYSSQRWGCRAVIPGPLLHVFRKISGRPSRGCKPRARIAGNSGARESRGLSMKC